MIKSKFKYLPKRWMMNRHEYSLYKTIYSFLDPRYSIIPQVHLDDLVTILYNNQKDRLFSLRHINQKSVDFVICNKESMHPLLAIELDGNSHKNKPTVDRDPEVERILSEANIPLLRLENNDLPNQEKIKLSILEKLK